MENTSSHDPVKNKPPNFLAAGAENIKALSAQELLTAIGYSEGRNWDEAVEPNRELIARWWAAQDDKAEVIRDSVFRLALVCNGRLKSEYPGILEFELLPILVHLGLVCLDRGPGTIIEGRELAGKAAAGLTGRSRP